MSDRRQRVRLGEVATKIGSGATPRGGNSVYTGYGASFIRSQNVYDFRFEQQGMVHIDDVAAAALNGVTVDAGDVLLNITGDSVARCCLAPPHVIPARVSQHVMIVRPDPAIIDGRYLQALLTEPCMKGRLLALAGAGATRPALTKAHVAELEFDVPPISEQRAIAEMLGVLDDKIEANREVAFLYSALGSAVFAQAEKVEVTLANVAEVLMGQSPPGLTYNGYGDGLPFYQGIRDFGFRHPSVRVWCSAPSRVAEPGDVLVSVRAPVGTLNVAVERCAIGRGVASLRSGSCPSLLYQALAANPGQWDPFHSEGTVFGSIGGAQLRVLRVAWPVEPQIAPLEAILHDLDLYLEAAESESRVLSALRDALLPKLLSGELRVRDC